MAQPDRDPVLRELIRRVNDSGQTAVPVTRSVHGEAASGQHDKGPFARLLGHP